MKKLIIIFGGTSEGRKLAEFCARRRIRAAVSVATEYGASLLPDSPWLEIHTGAMGREEMETWIGERNPALVLDATHPYAAVVTEHIRQACETLGLPRIRVLRDSTGGNEHLPGTVKTVGTVREAVSLLAHLPGNILAVTGSKELGEFTALADFKERVFARVLPSSSVLAACEALGFPGSHMFAMQGPFSVEMNAAMIRRAEAAWLVTKEAGNAGGFEEKLEAAAAAGAGVIVVGRPKQEEGVSLEEAEAALEPFADLKGWERDSEGAERPPEPSADLKGWETDSELSGDQGKGENASRGLSSQDALECCQARMSGEKPANLPRRVLILAGAGMGTAETMTQEAIKAVRECQVVFGAPRMVKLAEELRAANSPRYPSVAEYLPDPVFSWLRAHPDCESAVVLMSGDTGFYSGAAGFAGRLETEGWSLRILPGISSLSAMAAALGKSWEDAVIASRHGREQDVRALAERHSKVFVLTGGACRAETVCGELTGLPVSVSVGENLGSPEERIVTGRPEELAGERFASLAVMWIEADDSRKEERR